ncbi:MULTISPECIES: PTS sugar transporter subunit IIB [Aerococcus]|uniref:PTS sugar transporter subunit IIB n=1 Tax=Aerococcus sanguinicola TaxID=119206 RepID=A0A5N1GT03_9LACT|nr:MULTISPECIES: PTS sugar transporter subunit IIB [Aerococcus]KAA9301770.1 PTS sugar transporter subunit IIB [Aerococcus sanguinicola]MDK6368813.1 PTS sugar transporter subunit IIB [Aerococcus sp. UMB9870]MDK6679412.1 PTS sugar transporter subunit IIB [Aerococcus sp. UMB8608]MDK6685744.1 PTS sugar transporter subunit IIB [Aerococcus sp. UMB8623]MDK6939437.1 PTS sugar transporter subunit IIB [Aerococcus sp. UMB8487]
MTISLVRVDDRVIHGQTTTRWTKARPCYGILVVSDKIHADKLRRRVLKAAAGKYKLGIYTEKQSPDRIQKAIDSDKNYFLISDSPQNFASLLKAGVRFGDELNIGPMNTRPGTKVLGRTVAIDEEDYAAFDYIESQGVKISFQLLPDDEKKSWASMKKKFDSL